MSQNVVDIPEGKKKADSLRVNNDGVKPATGQPEAHLIVDGGQTSKVLACLSKPFYRLRKCGTQAHFKEGHV